MDMLIATIFSQCIMNTVSDKQTNEIQRIEKITFSTSISPRKYRKRLDIFQHQRIDTFKVGNLQMVDKVRSHYYNPLFKLASIN